MSQSEAQSDVVNKPPLLWLQASIFAITLLVALTLVPWYGFTHGYSWTLVGLAYLFLWANGLSITAGYHRLWAHRAYKAHPVLKVLFALFGAAALQNSALIWCSGHRRHHRHVDDNELDPYSAKRGLWFSHMGWMLREYDAAKEDFSNAPDLLDDSIVSWQHRNYLAIAIAMNIILPVLIGLLVGDVIGALLLAGVLRLVISHHTTFFINSLAHFWGNQPYSDESTARDNSILALLTYGEGYHNFHHTFQQDYRNGARWWQFDPTKWLIKAGSWMGLTTDLKRIPSFKVQRSLLDMQFKRAEQKLAKVDTESKWAQQWRELLDKEYQHFAHNLNQWTELQREKYLQKKERLSEATHEFSNELQHKWHSTAFHSRLRELNFSLKMQRKRMQHLLLQLSDAQPV